MARKRPAATPVPYIDDLDNFVGKWVAVRAGEVVAVADSSRALVYELRKLGTRGEGAVAQYVRPSTDGYIVGIG